MKSRTRDLPPLGVGISDSGKPDEAESEKIEHDDMCAICHLLLYRPVTTQCNHTLCEDCMAQWADVSITTQIRRVGLNDAPITLLPNQIETRCPMCRTPTTATLNQEREATLKAQHPETYRSRELEHERNDDDFTTSVETLTLYIGNHHRMIRPDTENSANEHQWTFFVRPSRTDLIEEVHIFLHPTFPNPRVFVQYPPYEIHRVGWGIFTISTNIILKAGYSWLSSEAEDAPDGGRKGKLPLSWDLDFEGSGSQGRCRLKVKREKEGQDKDNAAQREHVGRLWTRQRETDPDWTEDSRA